jgi:hypothetical protein
MQGSPGVGQSHISERNRSDFQHDKGRLLNNLEF